MIHPGVQFKAVERDSLSTDRDFGEVGADFGVETVAVHAEITWSIAEAEESRDDAWLSLHTRIRVAGQDKSLSRLPVHARVRD